MKIGIIGLLPDQTTALMAKHPQHDLSFLKRERERGPAIRAFSEALDKVILVTKFVSHKTSEAIPREKLVMVTGGLSAIGRVIETLPVRAPAPIARPVPTFPKVTEMAKTSTDTQPNIVTLRADAEGRFDYSIIQAASVGDVIRMYRPQDTEQNAFVARIANARSRLRSRFGITTTVEFSGKHADVKVTEVAAAKPTAAKPAKAAPVVPSPVVEPVVASVPAVSLTSEARALWTGSFIAHASLGYEVKECAKFADGAVREFSNRFSQDASR